MTALVLSTVVLACGPLLGWLLRSSAMGLQLMDGFVFASILGLCFTHLIPDALAGAGAWAALPLVLGFFAPMWMERKLGALSRERGEGEGRAHGIVLFLVVAGLVAHTVLDGAALAGLGDAAGHGGLAGAVAAGIVIHRLPVGLLIWWAVRPLFGAAAALTVLAFVAAGTVLGYWYLGASLEALGGEVAGLVTAFVAGSILHVVLHQTTPEGFSQRSHNCPHWAGTGAIVALGLLYLFTTQGGGVHVHDPAAHQGAALAPAVGEAFWELLVESAPALLLGFLAAGLVQTLLPEAGIDWLKRGNALTRSFKGMAFGLPLPICSCGVVPVYESLVRRGAPAAAGLAFLVATPELGLDALLLSIPLLGMEMALVRLGAAVVVALAVGLLVGGLAGDFDASKASGCDGGDCCAAEKPRSWGDKLRSAWRYGMVELVDHTGPWIFTGLLVAAVLEPHMTFEGLRALPVAQQVLLMTLVGMPVYVCATGATPIAAVLLVKGVNPGAVIAFLLAGPATNVTTFGVLRKLHGLRVAGGFVATMLAACFGAGMVTGRLFPDVARAAGAAVEEHAHGALALACTAALGLAFVSSLLRQGPRGLVRQVIVLEAHEHGPLTPEVTGVVVDVHDGHHGHGCSEAVPTVAHDHGCGHDHGCEGDDLGGVAAGS